jgi:hypothetical protein
VRRKASHTRASAPTMQGHITNHAAVFRAKLLESPTPATLRLPLEAGLDLLRAGRGDESGWVRRWWSNSGRRCGSRPRSRAPRRIARAVSVAASIASLGQTS